MYNRKQSAEEIQTEDTAIWACTKPDCKGWMRDNFAFEYHPTCRICSSPMQKDTKLLPVLVNTNGDLKMIKKGISIE